MRKPPQPIGTQIRDTPVRENVARLKSQLRRNGEAMRWLLSTGLKGSAVDSLHLGLKDPYAPRDGSPAIIDPLCVPHLDAAMRPLSRYSYLRVPGVTQGGPDLPSWGPGHCTTYRLGACGDASVAAVTTEFIDSWLAWQSLKDEAAYNVAVLCRSKSIGLPAEWRTADFWRGFGRVVILPGDSALELLRALSPHLIGRIYLLELPAPFSSLTDMRGGPVRFAEALGNAEPWTPDLGVKAEDSRSAPTGRFAANPVDITGAFVRGFSYYPFSIEERAIDDALGSARLVQSYTTLVLRSDGQLLDVCSMPAPYGTDVRNRVLALSDGTRIKSAPIIGHQYTWSHKSIEGYIAWKKGHGERPFRKLPILLEDVEAYLISKVVLPRSSSYLIASLYIALSHVFQVFDAVPLLMVTGPENTGKSELAEAITRLGFNAVMAGRLRAAGMIRLIDETNGLLVLDGVDGIGRSSISGPGDLAQTLRMSYKRSTAAKPLADRQGRVRIANFFGPKVLTSTLGADASLISRLLTIQTQTVDQCTDVRTSRSWSESDVNELRDELHCWGLSEAGLVGEAYRSTGLMYQNRRQEIIAPILALASYSRDEDWKGRVELALRES